MVNAVGINDFPAAAAALRNFTPRIEIEIEETPAPAKLATHALALSAECIVDDEELASGRFVLLYEPEGHETWDGNFRCVTFIRAQMELQMGVDPLIPEVGWSWFEDALTGLEVTATSGTVTQATSASFGQLEERGNDSEIEIRASWTAIISAKNPNEIAAHFAAWCELLAQCAGLAPITLADGVASIARTRS